MEDKAMKTASNIIWRATLSLAAVMLTATMAWADGLSGQGTVADPYLISSVTDWNTFATNINAGTNASAYYKLSDSWDNSSNPVTTMVGIYNSANDKHPFTGTFDGNGKTLTVNLTASTNYCAPFECTNGATFKDLTIAGSITTSQKYAASLSAYNEGTINIMNCHSEAIISSTYSGQGMHGGFMGWNSNSATLNFTGCSFRGKMLGSSSTENGGFVGYNNSANKTSYTDCVFAPTEITMGTNKSYTFDRLAKSFNNAYYTQAFGNAQGKLVYADIPDNTVYSTVMQDYNLSYYLPVTVSGVRASYIATGSNIHPEPTVKTADGTVLTKGTHYNVTYSSENDKDAGNYTLTVTGISPYSGSQVISYEVKSVNLNITSANDWNQFATNVNDGNDYSGVTVTLGNNISVSTMVGTSDNRFMGTFDGGNHTITFTKTDASTDDCAPFGYIEGATIKDLTIAGSITTSAKYGASIAAHTYGETNITNCHSTVTITGSNSGDGTHGGFVAVNEGSATLNFDGCSFKGKMLGSNAISNGGFVGYNSGTKINYTDCLFAPAEITMSASSSYTFNRNGKNSFTRTYYTQAFGTAEGEKVYATIPAGATTESVSAADGNTYYRVTGYQTITVIASANDWEAFANSVNEGGIDYSDVTVTLGANINVSTMAGTSSRQFKGTFEGAGHTLTLSLTNDGGECTAPFRYVNGASFANLRTAGTVNGGGQKYATGLIGQSAGTVGISSCRSSVQITSSVSGDATHGGFIGVADGTVTFTNCLFDGSITGASATNCGGFVGWRKGTLAFNNCLMAGAMSLSSTSGCATFNRNGSATFNKCYYRTAYGDVQGDAVGSMSNETLIDSDHLGSGWEISGSDVIPVIGKKTIVLATVSGLYRNYLYTGSEISISYIVTADDNTVLVKGTDYTEAITKDGSASAVKDKGDYTLTISGAGNYSGSQTFRFTVRDAIEYVESNGTEKTVNPQAVTAIEEGNKPIVMSAGWYFVQESTTISERITVSGDVKLILGDGTALTVPKGIRVEENNSLTIYSQSEGNGSLTINGVDVHNAGIGGNGGFHYDGNNYNGHNAGSITIHGGIITATGGYCGAGIGGGGSAANKGGSGGNITIDGGTVTAYGHASAAIGGGGYGNVGTGGSGGTIIISGGKVTAHSGNSKGGEGIGGCYGNTDGTVTLNCTKNDDFIQSSSYVGSVSVVSGVKLYDDDGHAYTGTLSNAQIANKKLGLGWAVSISNGITHGTVTADKAGVRAAAENKTVTLTVTPDTGYSIGTVSYNDGSDHTITPDENGKYKFTMPAKDVTVSATWKKQITITADSDTKTYDGTALTNSGYSVNTTLEEGDAIASVTVTGSQTNAGSSDNVPSAAVIKNGSDVDVTANYDITYANGTLTVNPASVTLTANSDTKEYSGTQQTVEGFTSSVDGLAFTGVSASGSGTNTGTYDVTFSGVTISETKDNTGNYVVTETTNGTLTITAATVGTYGALTITEDQNGKTAKFDGTSTETINVTSAVSVKSVIYERTFNVGKASTVMLPFEYKITGNEGGEFYAFVDVKKEGENWVATMKPDNNPLDNTQTLTANKPYLFLPTAAHITFTIPNEGVSICTDGGGNCQTADVGSHWTFKGMYSYKQWAANDTEIGKAYGFAGIEKTGVNVGDFVKIAAGAKIRPMSCYLLWSDTPNNARALTRGVAATDELPQSITVRLVGSSGETTSIGTLDTKTGELSFDGWYTLDGVRLSGKPSKPGLYINNGKKIVIK